jgi:hypothetical protein
MTLENVIAEAKALSLKSAHPQYIVDLGNEDFELHNRFTLEPGTKVYATYKKGEPVNEVKIKTQKDVETIKTEKPAKKEKKVAAKKVAAKKEKPAKKVAAKKEKPAKKVAAKKVAKNDEAEHPIKREIKGGACLVILEAIKKKACTKEQLAKLAKTKENNVPWYLGKIRNNGYKVTLTEAGYTAK